MTTAMQIAAYLRRQKTVYGEMQLQKLLYYSQAWALAWTGGPLFADEIEAWANGPVVRNVWAAAKYDEKLPEQDELSDDEKQIVDAVFAYYGPNDGTALGAKTHAEDPWIEARRGLPANAQSSAPLSQSTMRRFYTLQVVTSQAGPKQPVQIADAGSASVQAAAHRQGRRWRGALDALAHR
jgi:uncharacterized phage-associated protein